MRPFISKADFSVMSEREIRKICKCETLCNEGIAVATANDGFVMCRGDAAATSWDIRKILEPRKVFRPRKDPNFHWPDEATNKLIDELNANGWNTKIFYKLAAEFTKTYKIDVTYNSLRSKSKKLIRDGKTTAKFPNQKG